MANEQQHEFMDKESAEFRGWPDWRVGRKHPRRIYDGVGNLIGVMKKAHLAKEVVDAFNATTVWIDFDKKS